MPADANFARSLLGLPLQVIRHLLGGVGGGHFAIHRRHHVVAGRVVDGEATPASTETGSNTAVFASDE